MELKEIVKQLILGGYSNSKNEALQGDNAFQELIDIAHACKPSLSGKKVYIRYIPFGQYQCEGLRMDKELNCKSLYGIVVNDTYSQLYIDGEKGFHIIPYKCIIELHEDIDSDSKDETSKE